MQIPRKVNGATHLRIVDEEGKTSTIHAEDAKPEILEGVKVKRLIWGVYRAPEKGKKKQFYGVKLAKEEDSEKEAQEREPGAEAGEEQGQEERDSNTRKKIHRIMAREGTLTNRMKEYLSGGAKELKEIYAQFPDRNIHVIRGILNFNISKGQYFRRVGKATYSVA